MKTFVCSLLMTLMVALLAAGFIAAGENLAPNPSAEEENAADKPVGWGHYQDTPDEWGTTTADVTQKDDLMQNRWFTLSNGLESAGDLEKVKAIVTRAAAHGFNGVMLSSKAIATALTAGEASLGRLAQFSSFCNEKGIEVIPMMFSVGYGGFELDYNRNFSAALPATIPLTVEDGKAVPNTSGKNYITNGDFEEYTGNEFTAFRNQSYPGEISFVDTEVFRTGKTSIRFEKIGTHTRGSIAQALYLKPGYTYRFTCMVKIKDIDKSKRLRVKITQDNGNTTLGRTDLRTFNETQDWKQVKIDFDVFTDQEIWIDIGSWKAKKGTFWIDDMRLHERGALTNIVRRKGTPLSLRSKDGSKEYIEGKDFKKIEISRSLQHVTLLPGSSIQDGDELVLSCYKMSVFGKQRSLCMSNPDLFDYWGKLSAKVYSAVPFQKVFFSMDEIRSGGGCHACRNSGKSMAQILGDCVTRQTQLVKKLNPDVEVYIWSDMFDPRHNAVNNYYNVVGDYTGSLNYIPRETIITIWGSMLLEDEGASLQFFSKEGFRTMGATHYDDENLDESRKALQLLKNTKGGIGIIYTTWHDNYNLLEAFGDMVSGK